MKFLWHDDADDFRPDPGERERCTPEKLLKFIQDTVKATGQQPTLLDCKHRFGGILGPMVDYWKLKEEGKI